MVYLKASENSWGLIAKIFHWFLAILLIWQIFTGFNLHNMEFSPSKIALIGIHKIIGTLIFTVVVLRLIWKFINSKPNTSELPIFHRYASNMIHILLYTLVVWIPIQGTMMTQAGGFDVKLLGFITVPKFIETNFEIYPTFVQFHYQSMIALIVIFSIHLSAGLYHRFIKLDIYGVWNRMSFWGKD
ncbi:cytochrome b/b6 domain-containing protein [Alphaproteobacteria bacterium]|nr:cytochrome b/b6 domain-containing protein [Alphaproteobacteria bacterium]